MSEMVNFVMSLPYDDLKQLPTSETTMRRRLSVHITGEGHLYAFGYMNDNLVLFSRTQTSDLLTVRRIFEMMKSADFAFSADIETVLEKAGIQERDLRRMCAFTVDNLEADHITFSGVITGSSVNITGVDFAERIKSLPARLRAQIKNIGKFDAIYGELKDDYEQLEIIKDQTRAVAVGSDEYDNLVDEMQQICSKWQELTCLNMHERLSLRDLYFDVSYYVDNFKRQEADRSGEFEDIDIDGILDDMRSQTAQTLDSITAQVDDDDVDLDSLFE